MYFKRTRQLKSVAITSLLLPAYPTGAIPVNLSSSCVIKMCCLCCVCGLWAQTVEAHIHTACLSGRAAPALIEMCGNNLLCLPHRLLSSACVLCVKCVCYVTVNDHQCAQTWASVWHLFAFLFAHWIAFVSECMHIRFCSMERVVWSAGTSKLLWLADWLPGSSADWKSPQANIWLQTQ